jgi:hypothetical protein
LVSNSETWGERGECQRWEEKLFIPQACYTCVSSTAVRLIGPRSVTWSGFTLHGTTGHLAAQACSLPITCSQTSQTSRHPPGSNSPTMRSHALLALVLCIFAAFAAAFTKEGVYFLHCIPSAIVCLRPHMRLPHMHFPSSSSSSSSNYELLADSVLQTTKSSVSVTKSPKPTAPMSPSTTSSVSSPAHPRSN